MDSGGNAYRVILIPQNYGPNSFGTTSDDPPFLPRAVERSSASSTLEFTRAALLFNNNTANEPGQTPDKKEPGTPRELRKCPFLVVGRQGLEYLDR